jgi:hypothetical protein
VHPDRPAPAPHQARHRLRKHLARRHRASTPLQSRNPS